MAEDDEHKDECWLCFPGRKSEIFYTDVLGMKWCEPHYNDHYREEC